MMKLTIERSLLLKGLSHVQSIVERRQTIPILSNVLMQAEGNAVLLKATDNEIEIAEKIEAVVEEEGALTVPAHKLYDIVRRLPDGAQVQMTLSEETNQVLVVSGRARFALASLPAEGFPVMAKEEMPHSFELSAADFLGLIGKTGFAVSLEETRYNLNGIYLHEKAGEALTAVATDGHRLACARVALPEGAAGMPGVIVPRKTISELAKLLSETEENLNVSLSENQIRFCFGDIEFSSRLIDGSYPDYEKVIPQGNDKMLRADAAALSEVIERVSVVSEKSRGIKLSLSDGLLRVTAASADEGSAEDEMDASYDSDALEIGFNYRYLLDILSQVKSGSLQMLLQDGVSPVILKDAEDAGSLYVLMPMRV